MNDNDRLNATLQEVYKRVVKEVHKTQDKLQDHRQLYRKNKTAIHHSLKQKLTALEADILTLKQNYKETLNELEINGKKNLEENDKKWLVLKKNYDKRLKEHKETLEKKRELSTLKEQKLTHELNQALNKINHQFTDEESKNHKKLEEAKSRYQELTDQVNQETELKKAALINQHAQRHSEINQALTEKQTALDKEHESLEEKLALYEKTAQKQIVAFQKTYEKALQPLDLELKELRESQSQERKSLEQQYETEIIKKKKFQKEKEKLGDNAAVNDYTKEIKKLIKQQAQALEEKSQEHQNVLTPIEETRKNTIAKYSENFLSLKSEIIQKISDYLNSMMVIRAKKLIETNNHNILLLKEDAKLTYEETTLEIDHKLQHLNFTQTLEEANLYFGYIQDDFTPQRALLEHQHKHHYDLEKNELTKAKNYAKQNYETQLQLEKLQDTLNRDENAIHQQKLEAIQRFDRFAVETEHHIQLIKKDHQKEQLLIKHYYTQARNYTALKNQSIKAYQPQFESEIETRKKQRLKTYKIMLDSAEKEHHDIIEDIETIYEQEMAIYQDTALKIEKEHQKMINEMMTSQALERNKDIEIIELCDPKKDKQKIKKLKRELTLKQEHHDQALAIKKRELEQKLALYKKMIETIKAFRLQSLEEAETLLMHIKDQIHQAMDYTLKTTEKDLQAYHHLYYETKHSADLFETFQLQRNEDTSTQARHYMASRIAKEEDSKATTKEKLDLELDRLNRKLQTLQHTYKEQCEDTELNHDEALTAIDRLSKENAESLSSAYESEKRRLENLRLRAKREYDSNLKNLNNTTHQQQETLFTQKDQAEAKYKETLQNRDKEAENYVQERENLKQKDLENMKSIQQSLIKLIAENPTTVLDEKAVPTIQFVLKGDINLKNF